MPITVVQRVRHKDGGWRSIEVTGVNRLGDPDVGGIVAQLPRRHRAAAHGRGAARQRRAAAASRRTRAGPHLLLRHGRAVHLREPDGRARDEVRRARARRPPLPLARPRGRAGARRPGLQGAGRPAPAHDVPRIPGRHEGRQHDLGRPARAARLRRRRRRRRAGDRARHLAAEGRRGAPPPLGGAVPLAHPGRGLRDLSIVGGRRDSRREPGAGADARLRVGGRADARGTWPSSIDRPASATRSSRATGSTPIRVGGGELAAQGRHADHGAAVGADRRPSRTDRSASKGSPRTSRRGARSKSSSARRRRWRRSAGWRAASRTTSTTCSPRSSGAAICWSHGWTAGARRALDAEEIQKAAERGAALTRQLLAFSRRQALEPDVLEPARGRRAASKRCCRRLVGPGLDFELRLAGEPPMVRIEPGQLEQVLLNLVVNARDAMPDGGALTSAPTRSRSRSATRSRYPGLPPGRYARLSVRDTGAGIAPEVQRHVFEPFFTTKDPSKGTGPRPVDRLRHREGGRRHRDVRDRAPSAARRSKSSSPCPEPSALSPEP